jgi:hypothetical protein
MENLQGNLAVNTTSAVSSDCETITITDGNTYVAPLIPVAKRLFYVRKHTNGDQVLFESLDAQNTATSWSISRSKKGGIGFKDGWCFALLFAFPKVVGLSSLAATYNVGELIWYRNDAGSLEGFYIARQNMGDTGEIALVEPTASENGEWTKPTYEDFYKYIALKEAGNAFASDMEYGYGEEFNICAGDFMRNQLLTKCECPCKGNFTGALIPANEAGLLLESYKANAFNRNYRKGQTIVERFEDLSKSYGVL